jgi:hypothetical protein
MREMNADAAIPAEAARQTPAPAERQRKRRRRSDEVSSQYLLTVPLCHGVPGLNTTRIGCFTDFEDALRRILERVSERDIYGILNFVDVKLVCEQSTLFYAHYRLIRLSARTKPPSNDQYFTALAALYRFDFALARCFAFRLASAIAEHCQDIANISRSMLPATTL